MTQPRGRGAEGEGMPAILVADGDRLARAFLRDVLRSAGYRVRAAASGPEILRAMRREAPDLLLLDAHVPELHGLAVCEQVRRTPGGEHLPIILVTEPGGKAEMVKGLEAGADDFLFKPVDQAELMARVRGHLRAKSYRDELEGEKADLASVLQLSQVVTSTLSSGEIFRILVERTANLVDAARCSLILIRPQRGQGQVLASSQGPVFAGVLLDLDQYPEIRRAVEARQLVLVQDVERDPLMAPVRERVRRLGFRSLLVLPISLQDNVVGTLLLCTARATRPFTERNVRTCQLVAEIAANALQNAHVFESLELDRVNLQRRALEDDRLGVVHAHVFLHRLEDEVARSYRYRYALSCVAAEPDAGGAAAAFPVLRDLAGLLKRNSRRSDVVGRDTGSRLLLLLPETSEEGACVKARRLQEAARAQALGGAAPGQVTLSLGIAAGVPPAPTGAEGVVAAALDALEEARGRGPEGLAVHPLA